MSVTIDATADPYIHAHGTTAEVLAHLAAQNVPSSQVIAIWDATEGPTNCVYRRQSPFFSFFKKDMERQ